MSERPEAGFSIDAETGLLTRAALVERLEQEVARSDRYGLQCVLCLVRVRGYRQLVTSDPGAAGRMLERITWLIRLGSRRYDLAARWSEDTFALLLPHVGTRGAGSRLERMREAAASARKGPAIEIQAAVSGFPETKSSVEEIVGAAEAELGL